MDYRNEYLGYTVKESEQVIKQHRGVALGNGLAYTVLMFIPLVGILFAPSLALVGASITMKKAHKQPA
ncbi:MAG: EI24 domain-containing protein, partial [Bacteroidota bacterium]